ncbi:nuclear transport factor 2 family protein [Nocardioides sp. CFH 31398]|uniref:nuclear transport factor 2 family protein n=1 Tax=Nocardioides sp. CFH 31398 TaxID=2919579 RepID=UPI001F055361|nr:nuclear transport factor 2 family protein [Nocardioides sp. CFH 31398]MCH1867457.1 nuclear transport factor 2 family protein [Nocardioides sp. CFH 31398]
MTDSGPVHPGPAHPGLAHSELVGRYLEALARADLDGVLALFAEDAVVHSPLYGDRPAQAFYEELFADTERSELTLRSVMHGERDGHPVVSFWFDFDWTLADGTPAPFTVVDVAELDDEGLVTDLHIVYDTAPLRAAFERQRARPTR